MPDWPTVGVAGARGMVGGVFLSILVILNLRNGMSLLGVSGNSQTGVIGALLILSVLLPNVLSNVRRTLARRSLRGAARSDAVSTSGGAV